MPTATTLTMHGLAPTCRGRLGDDPTVLDESALAAHVADRVAAGLEDVLVCIDAVDHATDDEVKTLCAFLWTLRMEGANPLVVCAVPDVVNACRSLKLDQAFTFVATPEAAREHLTSLRLTYPEDCWRAQDLP